MFGYFSILWKEGSKQSFWDFFVPKNRYIQLQSWKKYLKIFSFISTISAHQKWKGTRLLSPNSEYTSCFTSCGMV